MILQTNWANARIHLPAIERLRNVHGVHTGAVRQHRPSTLNTHINGLTHLLQVLVALEEEDVDGRQVGDLAVSLELFADLGADGIGGDVERIERDDLGRCTVNGGSA